MNIPKTALVLGATGGIGGEVARQLQQAGWQVRALHRSATRVAQGGDGLLWCKGDAMVGADVLRAAQGASVIVHAVNPPGYQRWGELVLPMLDNTIAAASATGARIVLPGTVYNYGPDAFANVTEDAPQHPISRKGALRVAMERRLEAAAGRGVRSLILRSGDYFGPRAGGNWFSQVLVAPGRPLRRLTHPGRAGVGHAWAYLPDVARTMTLLMAREASLDAFARFHMRGHWDEDGTQFVDVVRRLACEAAPGARAPAVRHFPWWAVQLASPLVPLMREMKEMRYLWQNPIRLDNSRLVALLGGEPHTPLEEALHSTLVGLGCLDHGAAARATAVRPAA